MKSTTASSPPASGRTTYSLSIWGVSVCFGATVVAALLWFFIPFNLDLSRFSSPSAEEIRLMSTEQLKIQQQKDSALRASLVEYLRSEEVKEMRIAHFQRFLWPTLAIFNLMAILLLRPRARAQIAALLWPSAAMLVLIQIA